MCEFQILTYECRGDGYVWDADMDGYDPDDHSWPCPCCNTEEYLLNAKDDAESTSLYQNMTSFGTGVTIWESAVRIASEWNEPNISEILVRVGIVKACYEDPQSEDEVAEKIFLYEAS